jgi:hypothetical protein
MDLSVQRKDLPLEVAALSDPPNNELYASLCREISDISERISVLTDVREV